MVFNEQTTPRKKEGVKSLVKIRFVSKDMALDYEDAKRRIEKKEILKKLRDPNLSNEEKAKLMENCTKV